MNTLSSPAIQFGQNYKILIAEDNDSSRALAEETVPMFDEDEDTFTPILARNAEEAMEVLRQEPVDFVVTDGSMPSPGDGARLLRFIQELPRKPIASFMLSGDGRAARREALSAGAKDFFRKGTQSMLDVMAAIKRLVHQTSANNDPGHSSEQHTAA